jgi:tetratricopeptide (TPR) repeat protein
MKNWLRNSFLLMGCWSSSVWADTLDDGHRCLDEVDLQCAIEIQTQLLKSNPTDVDVLQFSARTDFYKGDFESVVATLETLAEKGVEIEDEGGFPARATLASFQGMVESQGDGVRVRHDPGLDRILVADALQTMERARKTYDTLLGGGPEYDIVLDIFPTARRFMYASGIPPEAVRTTGVIALSKWSRVLITSPRATAGGYGWMDTAAHEYIHLVVSLRTKDKAPVWLQEGLAKYLENAWRVDHGPYLSQQQQTLLAEALQTGEFVPFEKFARSMAYLDSGQEAALAYAQVATMVDFMVHEAGKEALVTMLDRIRTGERTEVVVSSLAGFQSFEDFQTGWKQFISKMELVQEQLIQDSISLDGDGGDFGDDPVLKERVDLAKFVRLGDLLMERGYHDAALIEYQKANDPEEPPSSTALARMVVCFNKQGNSHLAEQTLKQALGLYPENALVLRTAAEFYEKDASKALRYWQKAYEINPYEIDTHERLVALYTQQANDESAQKHKEMLTVLYNGGAIVPDTPKNAE